MAIRRKVGRVRGDAKREAILAAAWEVFREMGYAQASMDEITRRAGGSKVSLYAHFGNKESLFQAVVEQRAQAVQLSFPTPGSQASAAELLTALAVAMVASLTSPVVQDLHRVALSARMEGGEIGQLLYEHGTARVLGQLAEVLAAEMKSGRLRNDDPTAAAEAFFGLLLGAGYVRFALGVAEPATPKVRKERVARTVQIFLAAYECKPKAGDAMRR